MQKSNHDNTKYHRRQTLLQVENNSSEINSIWDPLPVLYSCWGPIQAWWHPIATTPSKFRTCKSLMSADHLANQSEQMFYKCCERNAPPGIISPIIIEAILVQFDFRIHERFTKYLRYYRFRSLHHVCQKK